MRLEHIHKLKFSSQQRGEIIMSTVQTLHIWKQLIHVRVYVLWELRKI